MKLSENNKIIFVVIILLFVTQIFSSFLFNANLLFAFYLLLKSPSNKIMEDETSFLQGKAWIFLGIPLMVSLIPIWIITSANSDWRLVNVVLFGIVFLLTLIPFYDP